MSRSAADQYQSGDFPDYHYVRFELTDHQLRGEMIRMTDGDGSPEPTWRVRDHFELQQKFRSKQGLLSSKREQLLELAQIPALSIVVQSSYHGPRGNRQQPKFPRLARQKPNYPVAQLPKFRLQLRGDPDAISYRWGDGSPVVGPHRRCARSVLRGSRS